jgi:xanthine dehydrogenase accessory factor
MTYGVSKEEAARFGLPCGGTPRLLQEPLRDTVWIDEVLSRTAKHKLVERRLDLATGSVSIEDASRGQASPSTARRCARPSGRAGDC